MSWVVVPGSNGIWEYDNAATINDTYPDCNGVINAGIRTYVSPFGNIQETYIKTRKSNKTLVSGELSKNYYDAKI